MVDSILFSASSISVSPWYAREYEKATPEDMQVLEEDMMLLEMDNPDDGKRDKPDAG